MKFIRYSILLAILLPVTACEEGFEEINRNPFFPTTTDIGPLFNTVVSSLRLGWNEQFYMHNEKLYQVTQQASLTAETFQNINLGTEEIWNNYYRALAHIREIEGRLDALDVEEESLNNIRAQLKILLAYKTFRITDLFGDIPFFNAGKAFESVEFARVAFDSQEEIYTHLLNELGWSAENINYFPDPVTASGEAYYSLGAFDTFLKGDMLRWIKFANSLRLRHAVRMADKAPNLAFPIIQDILENDLELVENGEDIVMMPADQNWLNLGVGWSFREHKKLRMGTTIWAEFSETDAEDGSGIFDPRAFIFFETNNEKKWVPFPQIPAPNTPQSGGIPYQFHRDGAYDFKGPSNIYSPLNYYMIRDEKYTPEVILTSAEVQLLKAEIYLRGLGVAENGPLAEGIYTSAVAASMTFWQDIVANSESWIHKPEILSTGEIFSRVNHPNISIFNPDNDKLKLIYAQRWIDAFRQPWEGFALLRRTNAVPREGGQNDFLRFTYPPSESEKNPEHWSDQASKMGGDNTDTPIWWIP